MSLCNTLSVTGPSSGKLANNSSTASLLGHMSAGPAVWFWRAARCSSGAIAARVFNTLAIIFFPPVPLRTIFLTFFAVYFLNNSTGVAPGGVKGRPSPLLFEAMNS